MFSTSRAFGTALLTALYHVQEWEFYRSGVLIDWRQPQVDAFVAIANSGSIREHRPGWLSQQKGTAITADAFIEDVMKQLEPLAGGRPTPFELRPNTVNQNFNIFKRLGGFEMEPFIVKCMNKMPVEMGGLAAVLRVFANPDFPFNTEVVALEGPADPQVCTVFF